jgi:HEAT repeat protein
MSKAWAALSHYEYGDPVQPLNRLGSHFGAISSDVGARRDAASRLLAVFREEGTPDAAKQFIAEQLRRLAGPRHVAALSDLVRDARTQRFAIQTLIAIPGAKADRALRRALDSLSGRSLRTTVQAIGRRGDGEAVSPLTPFLQSDDRATANAAAYALGAIGTPAAVSALPEESAHVSDRVLVDARLRGARRLARAGHEQAAARVLNQYVKPEASERHRLAALSGLAQLEGERGRRRIIDAIGADSHTVSAHAIAVTPRLGGSAVTRKLTALLPELPAQRQALLLEALADRGDRRAASAAVSHLTSDHPAVRGAAIAALGELGGAEHVDDLAGAAQSPQSEAVIAALERLSGPNVNARIIEQARSGPPAHRALLLAVLPARDVDQAHSVLGASLESDARSVRQAAIRALGRVGGQKAYAALLDAFVKPKATRDRGLLRRELVRLAKERASIDTALEPVLQRLKQAEPASEAALLRLLPALGGAAGLQAIETRLEADNKTVRNAAIEALLDWPTPAAREAVFALAQSASSERRRQAARLAYIELARTSDAKRAAMLKRIEPLLQNTSEKTQWLSAAGMTQSVELLERVRPYLDDESTREEAALAVLQIGQRVVKQAPAEVAAAADRVAAVTSSDERRKKAKALAAKANKQ